MESNLQSITKGVYIVIQENQLDSFSLSEGFFLFCIFIYMK